jgi:hypothetical protein
VKSAKPPIFLTPRDEEILRAVSYFRFLTARDLAYWLQSPKILNYWRSRLARLAGGTDLATHTTLCRFQLPTLTGSGEKIFTLGAKGRQELQREGGAPVPWSFRPSRLRHFSFSHLMHALVLTRCVVAASYWSRTQQEYSLSQQRLSYELARIPGLKVVPDSWLLWLRTDGAQFPILLEIDRGTQHQEPFKKGLHERLDFIRSGQYETIFNIPAVIIAYATTGQLPTYRDTRLTTICAWIMAVLTERNMQQWAGIFRVTSLIYEDIYTTPLYNAALWFRPDAPKTPVPLFPT